MLHQFRCYLETLLGQIKMRAVLANVTPAQFGADNGNSNTGQACGLGAFAVAV